MFKYKNFPCKRYPKGRNTVETNFNGSDYYDQFKYFIDSNNIPAMDRKWKF